MSKKERRLKTAVCLILSLLMIGCTVGATKAAFNILEQKRDNPLYFSECLSPSFDPENSEAVSAEIKTLTEKILTYATMKNDLTLFENAPYVMDEIDRLKTNTERAKADTAYFTEEKIKADTLDSETVNNGFAVLSDNETDGTAVHFGGRMRYAKTDMKQIERYYDCEVERQSEEIKRNASTPYREAEQYLDSLENVGYRVTAGSTGIESDGFSVLQTGADNTKTIQIRISSDGTVTTDGVSSLSGRQQNAVRQAAADFSGPLELKLIISGSLLFNEALKNTAALHSECRSLVLSNLMKAAILVLVSVISIVLFVILLPLAKNRKGSAVLPLLFAVLSAAVILLSVWLLSDSVKLFLNPTAGTSWLKLDTSTIPAKACFHCVAAAVGILGFLTSLKAALLRKKKRTDYNDSEEI